VELSFLEFSPDQFNYESPVDEWNKAFLMMIISHRQGNLTL
jgi:hypothetical protein